MVYHLTCNEELSVRFRHKALFQFFIKSNKNMKAKSFIYASKKHNPPIMADFYIKEYVPWEECERVMGKRLYNKFIKWMYGQGCYQEGVFPWDLEKFLYRLT